MKKPPPAPGDAPDDADARLPADRDESAVAAPDNAQHRENRRTIRQGHADVEAGIQDTERIGVPTAVPSSDDNR